ncbi:MAG: Zn-ribbon domain-containing OB-fold protein [Janthinobacterium lividum]
MTEILPDWTKGSPGLVVHSCFVCGHRWYFQRAFCPSCGSATLTATASAGLGTVYAVTRVDRAPSPEWRDLAPYGIALIDLDEGLRAMTHADPALRIGDRVHITFRTVPTGTIPFAEITP